MGVSFAIPIDVAMEVADQLKSSGRVSRGWLGVVIQEVSRELAESFGLERPHGALISEVMPSSPAEDGGLLAGDIITEYNGNSIERSAELPHYVGRTEANSEAELKVMRDGEELKLEVEIGELPDEGAPRLTQRGDADPSDLGLGLENLPDAVLNRLNLEGGVRVVQAEDSAAESGVRVGDIITKLNNLPVEDVDGFREIAESLPRGRRVPP